MEELEDIYLQYVDINAVLLYSATYMSSGILYASTAPRDILFRALNNLLFAL